MKLRQIGTRKMRSFFVATFTTLIELLLLWPSFSSFVTAPHESLLGRLKNPKTKLQSRSQNKNEVKKSYHHTQHTIPTTSSKKYHYQNSNWPLQASESPIPGQDAFSNRRGSYVPYGLTPEEYAAIKKKEKKESDNLNYAAWGPRFRRDESAPEGNWMTNSALWTKGFRTNDNTSARGGNTSPSDTTQLGDKMGQNQRMTPLAGLPMFGFLTSLILTKCLSFLTFFLYSIANKMSSVSFTSLLLSAFHKIRIPSKTLVLFEISLFAIVSIPVQRTALARLNEKQSWSLRKSCIVLVGAGISSIIGVCAVAYGISRAMAPL